MKSKENTILELFFNNPTKHWGFEEIVEEADTARSKADKWLKRFIKSGWIKRIKPKGKMPYYLADYENPSYKNKKRIFALEKLYDTGFLNHLYSLKKTKTIILFGSFTRWDWHSGSDIDLFIYGDLEGLDIAPYELKLHRDIQLFICKNKKDISKLGEGLITNILKGDLIKGDIKPLEVCSNA